MTNIRIPTKDAPAGHHLTFICAVAELAHRVIENVTGLTVILHVSVHSHSNVEREPALTQAAIDASLPYDEGGRIRWHAWEPQGYAGPRVTFFMPPKPPAPLCDYDDCDQAALPGGDFCATHEAEHAENMAACEQVEPETPAEHRQQVTAAMEQEQPQ